MPLLVVPLAVDEVDLLTLGEWEALLARERVVFERDGHPLAERLRARGSATSRLEGDGPDPGSDGDALVADPDPARLAALAQAGAIVTSGVAPAPDSITAARGAYVGRRATAALGALTLIMARLRGPGGCPWDAEQTHRSLQVHLQEETHEVLAAIDAGTLGSELEEELGDLLLQVAFHAQMAADDGRFDLAGVADSISRKLIRRHPHVFGAVEVSGANEVIRNWEAIKASEKGEADEGGADPFDGIPGSLPALLTAYKSQKRAARFGFEVDAATALDRASERLRTPADEAALGEALFWLVAVARAGGIDPESALRRATERFQSEQRSRDRQARSRP